MIAKEIDFDKVNGLVPAIITNVLTNQVLMLGYMNLEAVNKTEKEGKVTFFSRTKNRLWTKGEESGNFLWVKEMLLDCDQDTLLIKALPEGNTCHKGVYSCFQEKQPQGFLYELEHLIKSRQEYPVEGSYTNHLFEKGINKIAQKVGEEAVELVIEAKDDNRDLFVNEAADLLYHLVILLRQKNIGLNEIEQTLLDRNK